MHPGLLDGAIQLMMAAAMGDAGPLKLLVPTSVARVALYASGPGGLACFHARVVF